MLDLRPVGYVIGLLTAVLGGLMTLPMTLDFMQGNGNWRAFAASAGITALAGGLIALACANQASKMLDLRQSFVLTTGVWIVLPLFGALPLMLGAPHSTFTDAMFEAMSGMTTAGTTVFIGLDHLPQGTNLWRAMLQWLGGLGIVIVALIFLPVMKVGGMQFFRAEGFDTLGKVLPRALDISSALLRIYAAMTLACAAAFWALGMPSFEAVIHALAAVSTGGFSSRDASFAGYGAQMELIAIMFMILSTLPFIRFIQALQGHWQPIWQDEQVRTYLLWTLIAILAICSYRVIQFDEGIAHSFTSSAFNVVSIFSGTGFTTTDVQAWGPLPFVILLIVGFIGGCTSSTGCSVKVFRYLVMFQSIRTQIRRLLMPYSVEHVRLGRRKVEADVINSVVVFFTLFIVTYGLLALALSMTGLSPRTALTAAWTAVADIGPVYGPEVSASGAVSGFPPVAKWLMILGMMLGRLEILSVLVLFSARFWAR